MTKFVPKKMLKNLKKKLWFAVAKGKQIKGQYAGNPLKKTDR